MSRSAITAAGRGMTMEELLALPVAVDLPTAGRAWCIGKTKAHELAAAGEFPCPVLRIGNALRVTRADLLRSLGIDPNTGQAEREHQNAERSAPDAGTDRTPHDHSDEVYDDANRDARRPARLRRAQ